MHIIINEHVYTNAANVVVRLVTPATGPSSIQVFFNDVDSLLITDAAHVTSIDGVPVALAMSALEAALQTATEFTFYNNETNTSIGNILHASTVDTAPLDTDEIYSYRAGLLRTAWTNVKAHLKTYFDTLYLAGSSRRLELPSVLSTTLKAVQDQTAATTPLMLSTEGVSIQPPALTGSSSISAFTLLQTLNTSANVDIIAVTITNTASGSSTNFLIFKSGSTTLFNIKLDGTINTRSLIALANNTYDIGSSGVRYKDGYFAGTVNFRKIICLAVVVGDVPMITRAMAGQTANIFEAQDSAAALYVYINASGYLILNKRFQGAKGATVASANDLTLGGDGNLFHISGTTQINGIATVGWQAGSEVTFIFDGVLRLKHLTAAGAGFAQIFNRTLADITTAVNTVVKLMYDGTYWYQTN